MLQARTPVPGKEILPKLIYIPANVNVETISVQCIISGDILKVIY